MSISPKDNSPLATGNRQLETENSQPGTQNSERSKTWNKLYALVLTELIVLVVAFYFFMKYFS